MKAGDMVRFKSWAHVRPPGSRKQELGLLIEYHAWEKVATIMFNGEIIRVAARDVEKAGKRDYGELEEDEPNQSR